MASAALSTADPSSPTTHTAWNLGHSDNTAIWFFQRVGFEFPIIDYLQDSAQMLDHYLKALQERGYLYGRHYLPHDAESNQLEGRSVADQIRGVYGDRAVIVAEQDEKGRLHLGLFAVPGSTK